MSHIITYISFGNVDLYSALSPKLLLCCIR